MTFSWLSDARRKWHAAHFRLRDGVPLPCVHPLNRFLYWHKADFDNNDLSILHSTTKKRSREQSLYEFIRSRGLHALNEKQNRFFTVGSMPLLSLRGALTVPCGITKDPIEGLGLAAVPVPGKQTVQKSGDVLGLYMGPARKKVSITSGYQAEVRKGVYIDSVDTGNLTRFINHTPVQASANVRLRTWDPLQCLDLLIVEFCKEVVVKDEPVELLLYYGPDFDTLTEEDVHA
ncbi:hypothetical protein CYMTET_25723 [Cymbomonas tetramitiformis]|uniref:Uncharacterized protein n=1 Tax=Cymbomonas tetramitiformis TaxID=36881 RepID=A0AAE0KYM9_9CHLO|nr:hypothetical protein CYMTET_25723 [Cymbomonas tetramitiformis]